MVIHIGRWRVSLDGLATIAVVLLLAYAFWPSATHPERERAYEAERILRRTRNVLVAAQTKTDTITRIVVRQDGRLGAQSDSLTRALAWADSVRQDVQSSNADLRVALDVAIRRSQTFQVAALALRDSVRELIAAHALERLATNQTLAAADSAVQAWQDAAAVERQEARKKFWRGAAVGAVLGAVITGGVTLLAVAL